jgi:hypothetical protein
MVKQGGKFEAWQEKYSKCCKKEWSQGKKKRKGMRDCVGNEIGKQ